MKGEEEEKIKVKSQNRGSIEMLWTCKKNGRSHMAKENNSITTTQKKEEDHRKIGPIKSN